MTKKCYCINPFCKCLFGCGCTLADKSVGKCMCCIMEETNKKINKLRRKKPTTIIQEVTKDEEGSEGNQCDCGLKDGKRFYDIIVDDGDNYVSCRYGCLVEINNGTFDIGIDDWQEKNIITNEYLNDLENVKNIDKIKYEFKNDQHTYLTPTFIDKKYLLLFVDKETLKYAVFYTEDIDPDPESTQL